MIKKYDVVIIGAGAAGMMCAIEAGKRGRKVVLLDHAKKIGEKIRISGGGRCNFTNIYTNHKSALWHFFYVAGSCSWPHPPNWTTKQTAP